MKSAVLVPVGSGEGFEFELGVCGVGGVGMQQGVREYTPASFLTCGLKH